MKAVVFIDVQKDFIDGALRNDAAIKIMPNIIHFAKYCVENDEAVIYATRDTHEKTTFGKGEYLGADMSKEPQSGYLTTLEGKKLPVEHCIEGTDGWMIDNELMAVLDGHCTFINKPTFGSFDLAEIIAEDQAEATRVRNMIHGNTALHVESVLDEIIICGFVSSICVAANATILRAKFPNTKITVLKGLCAGITDEDHEAAMKVLEMQQIDIA